MPLSQSAFCLGAVSLRIGSIVLGLVFFHMRLTSRRHLFRSHGVCPSVAMAGSRAVVDKLGEPGTQDHALPSLLKVRLLLLPNEHLQIPDLVSGLTAFFRVITAHIMYTVLRVWQLAPVSGAASHLQWRRHCRREASSKLRSRSEFNTRWLQVLRTARESCV